MGNPDVTINMAAVLAKELIIKGSFRYGVSVSIARLVVYLSSVHYSMETIHWLLPLRLRER